MSEVTGESREATARRGLPPWAVLLCGALATGVCLLLLFGPFYPYSGTPGQMMQYRLVTSLDGAGPRFLSDLLWNRFFLSTAVVLGVILMVLPWCGARRRERAAGSPRERPQGAGHGGAARSVRVSVTQRSSSLIFSDDGRVLDPKDPDAEMIARSVSDLRAMARAARTPWRSDYETSGGARAFLEVLRALNTGPVGVHRAEDGWGGSDVPETEADAVDAASPADRADPGDATVPAEPAAPAAGGGTDLPPVAGPASSTGSVYTPTTLYRSSTWDRDPEEEQR